MNKRVNTLLVIAAVAALYWGFKSPESENIKAASLVTNNTTPEVIIDYRTADPEAFQRNKQAIKKIMEIKDTPINEIRDFGYGAIPILTDLFTEANTDLEKARIAWVFWKLGWKSPEIEQALMPALDSKDVILKINAQWGIAKSAESDEVLEKLLYNLEHDPSAVVRDKAACALASDFIHISGSQRITLLRGLVKGLSNDIEQVRNSSILALKIQTGQTKEFVASADISARANSIEAWNEWLNEYERNF